MPMQPKAGGEFHFCAFCCFRSLALHLRENHPTVTERADPNLF